MSFKKEGKKVDTQPKIMCREWLGSYVLRLHKNLEGGRSQFLA